MRVDPESKKKQELKEKLTKVTGLGILLMVLGSIAIFQPLFTTLTAKLLFEEMLFAAGIVRLFYAFYTRQRKFTLKLILGLVYIITGLVIINIPTEENLMSNFILAGTIFLNGVIEVFLAIQVRRFTYQWGWILLSGIAAIILGILIGSWADAVWIMGILVGVNLLASGFWITVVSNATSSALQKAV